MLEEPLKILLADDKQEICNSLEDALLIEVTKFGLNVKTDIIIRKAFTDHAYDHGCEAIREGFRPDICISDLVFNGYSGIDLYKFMKDHLIGKSVYMCLYTGVEKKFDKRREAEIMASQTGHIKIVAKPNISEILEWFDLLLTNKFKISKKVEEKDPFDLL